MNDDCERDPDDQRHQALDAEWATADELDVERLIDTGAQDAEVELDE